MDEAGRRRIERTWRLDGVRGSLLFPSTVDVIVRSRYVSTATWSETDSSLLRTDIRFLLRHARDTRLSLRSVWPRV